MSGPHDLFARFAFGHPERAAAELRAVLPPELAAQVDWTCLQLEHQSWVDRWMALRMLRYVLRQLEHWRQQHPDSQGLPVVIPVVMYHGQEGGWTAARRVEELFLLPAEAVEQWRALVPRFEYLLDDLTAEREEALRARPGPPLARLAVLLLRSGRSENLAVLLEGWRPLMAQVLASPEGLEQIRAVVHYLFRIGGSEARVPLRRVLNSILSEQGEEGQMTTIADELIEEGRQLGLRDGLAEGQAKGRAEAVLRLLSVRGVAVDDNARKRILSCKDLDLLDRWLEQALNATRLTDLENL